MSTAFLRASMRSNGADDGTLRMVLPEGALVYAAGLNRTTAGLPGALEIESSGTAGGDDWSGLPVPRAIPAHTRDALAWTGFMAVRAGQAVRVRSFGAVAGDEMELVVGLVPA